MNLTLKQQLSIMACIAVLAVALLGMISYLLAKNTTIGSEQSNRINYAFELTADVLPPPLYMLETLKELNALPTTAPSDRADVVARIEKLIGEYNTRIQRWNSSTDLPKDIQDFMDKKLNPPSQKFINAAKETVIPLALKGDSQSLATALQAIEPLYAKHRAMIDELVVMSGAYVTAQQKEATSSVSTYQTWLYIIALLSVIVVVACSVFFSKKILSGLGADPVELQYIASAIARGDVTVRLPQVERPDSVTGAMTQMVESIKEGFLIAVDNARIKQALDAASANVMMVDVERNVMYVNPAMKKLLRDCEMDIRASVSQFSTEKIIGTSMDVFNAVSNQEMAGVHSLSSTRLFTMVLGTRTFRLLANPTFDAEGKRLGVVIEWSDRTQELAAEKEVGSLVEQAALGNFTARIPTEGKNGFFRKLADDLNRLVTTADKGLSEVARVLSAITKGDLTAKMDGNYDGTFGDLKNYCNDTTESLSHIIGEIRSSTDSIYTASSEIAQGNSDLSTRTEKQAANLEETASSMEEITSTVKLNADNAKQANTLAENASLIATAGGDLIQEVVVTMNSINESSQKISDIIGVIDGIAFQTNILALNAAVEAARAGDQGRGFAVVASEVRTLAQRSANAAKDIKGLISDSVKKIDNGNALVSKSGDTMKEIVAAIKRVNNIMTEISLASSEQSTAIEEVSNGVSQMDEMTQQNAALVEEAAAAAESLQSQADQLSQRVSMFRLSTASAVASSQTATRLTLSSGSGSGTAKISKISDANKKLAKTSNANAEDEWESF
jgi:methyl-accepting chemotaxis protein